MAHVHADGLFALDHADYQRKNGCTCVPILTRVLVDMMDMNITKSDDDVVATVPLAGGHKHHALFVAERQLQRWGIVDRRFAASIETSMPRKKDGKDSVSYSLNSLQKAYKGEGFHAGAINLLLSHSLTNFVNLN